MEPQSGADVQLELGGQKLNVKNIKSLNTAATLTILVVLVAAVALGGYVLVTHTSETKDASKELTSALQDMTRAAREQNCLSYVQLKKLEPEICLKISR